MIVIVIIALIATLTFPFMGWMRAKAAYAGCISNLTALHGGLSSYLGDHEMIWPQVPPKLPRSGDKGDMLAKWWHDQLEPYGCSKSTWLCKGDDGAQGIIESETYYSTYTVTEFDEQPNRAYQWTRQPWVMESGDLHGKGKGPNMIFPDGHIERGMSIMFMNPK